MRQPHAMTETATAADDLNGRPLGEYLIAAGVVSPVVIDYALHKQKIEGAPLGKLLVELGFTSGKDIARYLAHQRQIPFVDLADLPAPSAEAAAAFNRNICLTHGFLPLRQDGQVVEVVLGDAQPEAVAELVSRRLGLATRFLQGQFEKVAQAIQQHYYFADHPPDRLIDSEVRRLEADVDRAYSPARLLDHLLHLAVRERATDIHLAPPPAAAPC